MKKHALLLLLALAGCATVVGQASDPVLSGEAVEGIKLGYQCQTERRTCDLVNPGKVGSWCRCLTSTKSRRGTSIFTGIERVSLWTPDRAYLD